MTDLRELIDRELEQYLEWPATDKSHVTTASAMLFAEHVARLYADHIPDAGKMAAPAVQGELVSVVDEIPEHTWHGRWHTAHGTPVTFNLPQPHPMQVLHEDGTMTKGWTCHHWSWETERGIAEGANIIAWRFYDMSKCDASLRVAPQPAEQQPAPDVAGMVEALESLIKGYVRLLETGMDRITSLGGDCDPVPVMEQNDPWLRDARAVLADHRKQGGAQQ